MSVQIYGTLGPSCADAATLARMIGAGMTGIRLNLSHTTLREAKPYLDAVRAAERETGRSIGLLLDMQGPELRVGRLREPMALEEGSHVALGEDGIPLPEEVLRAVTKGQSILLDDGRLRLRAESADRALVERGGVLRSRKSAALPGVETSLPAMTAQDRENLALAPSCGVTAVMQPFVRSADDLKAVRAAMNECGGTDIRLFAKIENRRGMGACGAAAARGRDRHCARRSRQRRAALGASRRAEAHCRPLPGERYAVHGRNADARFHGALARADPRGDERHI